MHMKIYLSHEHLCRTVSLHLGRSIFDNIYSLTRFISDHNALSGMIMPDVLKSPTMSDVLNVLHINGIRYVDLHQLIATIYRYHHFVELTILFMTN